LDDVLYEIFRNPVVLAASVVAALALIFETGFVIALVRASRALRVGEQLPTQAFVPLLISGAVFGVAMVVVGLNLC
jgi:hypothetical protein